MINFPFLISLVSISVLLGLVLDHFLRRHEKGSTPVSNLEPLDPSSGPDSLKDFGKIFQPEEKQPKELEEKPDRPSLDLKDWAGFQIFLRVVPRSHHSKFQFHQVMSACEELGGQLTGGYFSYKISEPDFPEGFEIGVACSSGEGQIQPFNRSDPHADPGALTDGLVLFGHCNSESLGTRWLELAIPLGYQLADFLDGELLSEKGESLTPIQLAEQKRLISNFFRSTEADMLKASTDPRTSSEMKKVDSEAGGDELEEGGVKPPPKEQDLDEKIDASEQKEGLGEASTPNPSASS